MRRIAIAMLGVLGCNGERGTAGHSVQFDVAIEAAPSRSGDADFVTAAGWHVELDEAIVAVGPFYLWEQGSYAAASLDDEPVDGFVALLDTLGELVVPTAHAHPGDVHFAGGELRGEFLGQIAFDVLRGAPARVGHARGIAGEVRSLSVILDPPGATTAGDAGLLQGYHAYVVGTATRGRHVVPFEGGLAIPAEGTQREVDGIPLETELDEGGTLVVGVQPRAWFADAHFDQLDTPNAEGDRRLITAESQVAAAWYIGARTTAAFYARWTTDETFEDYAPP
jgi:hypothetical protein